MDDHRPRRLSLEALQALVLQAAKVIAAYRQQLEQEGVPPAEAWALAQRLEERILGPAFDAAEERPELAPLECPRCGGDQVLDVSGSDGPAWLCVAVGCGHHWRGGRA